MLTGRLLALVGCVGLVAGALGGWLQTPLQGSLRGYAFALAGPVDLADALVNPPRLLSFGALMAGIAVAVVLSAWRGRPLMLFWSGAAAALVALVAAGQVCGARSEILEAIAEQNQQRESLQRFAAGDAASNVARLFLTPLGTDTLAARVAGSLASMGPGWYAALGAGALLAGLAIAHRPSGLRRHLVALGIVGLGVLSLLLGPAAIAERRREQGDALRARGDLDGARKAYESALGWSAGLRENRAWAHAFGQLQERLGLLERPELHLHRGARLLAEGFPVEAAVAYARAAALDPGRAMAVRGQAQARVSKGMDEFKRRWRHKATTDWEAALAVDPGQVQAHLYLARAYLDVYRTDHALAAARTGLSRVADLQVRADLYVILGDGYSRQRRFVEARAMYQRSLAQYVSVNTLPNIVARERLLGL